MDLSSLHHPPIPAPPALPVSELLPTPILHGVLNGLCKSSSKILAVYTLPTTFLYVILKPRKLSMTEQLTV